jgi:hypothetical protein
MSGDTHSRHCWWLMLVVSWAHIADAGSGYVGHSRSVLSAPLEAIRVPSGLNAALPGHGALGAPGTAMGRPQGRGMSVRG